MDKEMFYRYLKIRNKEVITGNLITYKIRTRIQKEDSIEFKYGLSPSQVDLMLMLYFEEPRQISYIANYLHTKSTNATRLASELTNRGFCKKIKQPNKKAVFVDLTDTGKKIIEDQIDCESLAHIESYNKYFSLAEQEEIIELYERLTKLLSRML